MQSVEFEWTPRLEEIFAWGPSVHPYIGPGYETGDPPFEHYQPGMSLPDPADPHTFLQWCGLRDETIHEVSNKFNSENKDLVAPSCGYTTKKVPAGFYTIHYPVLDRLVHTYIRMLADFDSDYEESYEGYVKKAIQRGFKPEFAIFCGLHEDDPRAKERPQRLIRWFSKEPMAYMQDRVGMFSLLLMDLIREKLIDEGKVVVDEDGNDVIVDGKIGTEEERTAE